MNCDVTVLNLSGIYDQESFYRTDKSSRFIDLRDITGTNCMCDDAAKREIMQRIESLTGPVKTSDEPGMRGNREDFSQSDLCIHFIDNGNYHYLSALYLSMVKEPFSLVVLDHHPDMQRPMFDILSCGGWILDVIEKNEFPRDVHIIGADRHLIDELDESDKRKVCFYDADDVFTKDGRVILPKTEFPVYLSVDKDVIRRSDIVTNWDQGDLSAEQVLLFVRELILRDYNRGEGGQVPDTGAFCSSLLGVDICGECTPEQEDCDIYAAIAGNDNFNRQIIELLRNLN